LAKRYTGMYEYVPVTVMTISTFTRYFTLLLATIVVLTGTPAASAACRSEAGVTLQVLGSGGPIADDGRASSGYLVWVDGESHVMIDAGGGTFLRFGEAGARFESLEFVGISHLHTDHSADLPALLKSGVFSGRERPLPVAGPAGEGVFPGLIAFLDAMLGADKGAYAYLSGYLDGTNGLPRLEPREIVSGAPQVAFTHDDLRVDAMRVPHGIVPAVAFRVEALGKTLVFGSDGSLGEPAFVDFASGADVLVLHMVVPEGVEGAGRALHAPPSVIGDVAGRVAPGVLVLSHFMARSLRDLDENVGRVRQRYDGEIVVAEDLVCVAL